MTDRTLVFVDKAESAPPPDPSTDVVVLDTAWTRGPDDRPDLSSVRPALARVVASHNLFDESLARLDEVADAANLVEAFTVDGVTWWYHARSYLRLFVHELLLWREVLAEIAPPGSYASVVVPAARAPLATAARAARRSGATATPAVVVVGGSSRIERTVGPIWRRVRRYGRRAIDELLWPNGLRPVERRRLAVLNRRFREFRGRDGILAIVRGPSFHVVATADGTRRMDPYVAPVLDRLADQGCAILAVALDLSHRNDDDWEVIAADERLIPLSYVSRRWGRFSDKFDDWPVVEDIQRLARTPLNGRLSDLAPAILSLVSNRGRWLRKQHRTMVLAERLLQRARPGVMYTGWEGARTAWLGAARRTGIPVVAIQHGVIYPNTPDYCRAPHPALVRPDLTCVFGSYERDLLIKSGGYEPKSVVITGSPRAPRRDRDDPATATERDDVRKELGVAAGDRVLVVSAARHAVGDEIDSITMVANLLAGPLPGVHVVFKLHPEEQSGAHYEALLAGLARAGGYAAPPLTLIRDIDIYRLLRAADAHLGQYSTVLTDAVMTGTPNMISVGHAWADVIGYVEAGVAVPVRSYDDVARFMKAPRAPAPDDRERFLEAHFRSGDATARIADAIVGAMARPAVATEA